MNGLLFLTLKKPHSKTFWWKYIKNESWKSYLANKKQTTMFPVVSQLGSIEWALCFEDPFLHVELDAEMKFLKKKPGEIKFVQAWLMLT